MVRLNNELVNYSYWGESKATYNWGGHIAEFFKPSAPFVPFCALRWFHSQVGLS